MKKLFIAIAFLLPMLAHADNSMDLYRQQMNDNIDRIAEQAGRDYETERQGKIQAREAAKRQQEEVFAKAMVAADAKLRAKEGLPPRSEIVDNRTVGEKLNNEPVQVAQAATSGYNSPDSAYVRACVKDARDKVKVIGTVYSTAAGYDYPADAGSIQPSFPKAFRNPVRNEQYIHPIEFQQTFVRGFPTRVRVMYSSSEKNDPNSCVFQGIEFLDQTDAN